MNEYKTSDLTLASTLSYYGYVVQRLDEVGPRKYEFVFRYNEDLQDLIRKFYAEEARVEPNKFCAKQRKIKNQIYSNN